MTLAPTPDVSFIIAAYNCAATIEAAIASALVQTGVLVEVIVVDDRSSDATCEVVGSLCDRDPRIRLIALPDNLGPGGARNAGIAAARGRWLAVLDSDDTVKPDRCARMIERAEAAKATIVVDNLDVAYTDGRQTETMFTAAALGRTPMLTLSDFIRSNVLFQSTFNFGYMKPIFNRAFLAEHDLRFDPKLRIGEDYLLLASALAAGGTCAIEPTPGYVYTIREGSISRVLKLAHVDAMIAADTGFMARFDLTGPALAAQRQRTRSLVEARHFLMLVDAIKRRCLPMIVKLALRDPVALRHLGMPIAARARRIKSVLIRSGGQPQIKRQGV